MGGRQRLDKIIGDILEPNSELGANFPAPGVAGQVRRARIKGNPFERGLGSLGDAGGRGESSVWLPFIPLNPRSSHQLLAGLPGFCPLPTSSPTPSTVSPSNIEWGLSLWTRSRGAAVGDGDGVQARSLARGVVSSPHLSPLSGPFPPPSLWNEKGDGREKKEFSLEEGG